MTTLVTILLLTAFVLYHLAQWRQAQPRPPSEWAQDIAKSGVDAPLVSFLVPAWEALDDLDGFVAAFRALSYPNRELLLGAGGGDGSLALAQRLAGDDVRVIEQPPGQGKQKTLRQLYPLARGAILYLTDIDCRPTDDAVLPLIERLRDHQVQVVTGSIRPLESQRTSAFVRTQWAIERIGALQTGDRTHGLRGANAALTRQALDLSGAFGQDAISGTDYTLAKELTQRGAAIAYLRESEMPTMYPDGVGIYVRKQARWLRNVVLLGARYRAWDEVRGVATTLALPFVLLALLLLGIWWPPLALLALLALAHATLNRLRYAYIGGITVPLGSTLSTILADLGAGVLATSQILRGRITWS